MKSRSARLLNEIHRLATAYHWAEAEILRLSAGRRLAYLLRIERDADSAMVDAMRERY